MTKVEPAMLRFLDPTLHHILEARVRMTMHLADCYVPPVIVRISFAPQCRLQTKLLSSDRNRICHGIEQPVPRHLGNLGASERKQVIGLSFLARMELRNVGPDVVINEKLFRWNKRASLVVFLLVAFQRAIEATLRLMPF